MDQAEARGCRAPQGSYERLGHGDPGGLGDIKKIIKQEQDDEDPDDNGTDQNDDKRRKDHGIPEHSAEHTGHFLDNIHVPKGGGSAGHR